jgi:RNA polymerase sigma factor (sigma-70 family)
MASTLAKRLNRQEGTSDDRELSDEELLDRFLSGQEIDSQEAFRTLVVRHGPMVLGICRHVLNQVQDAEDAFQATFLVLARKGASIRDRRVLSGWLHEVAYRIAVKLRASKVRRQILERHGMAMLLPQNEPDDQGEHAAWNELRPVLHEEVDRLPEKYRIPVILSYLEGKTNEEVAELLRWPVGTVKGRLSRARDLLRSRLTKRGLALSAAFLMTALSRGRVFAEVVPADLIRRTVRLAIPPGPLGVSLDPPLSSDPGSAGVDLPEPVETIGKAGRRFPTAARLGVIFSLFLVLSLSVIIGTCMAVLSNGGGLSDLQAIFPMRFPSRAFSKMESPRSLPTTTSPQGDPGNDPRKTIEPDGRHCRD